MLKYNLFIRVLHWLVGILVVAIIILGYNMGGLPVSIKMQAYGIHKSIGVTIFFLMTLRLLVRIFTKSPPMPKDNSFLDKTLNIFSRLVHFAFYVIIISASVSGYVMSSASARQVKWFFDIDIPLIVEKDQQVASNARNLHLIIPIVILALLSLHVLGFIKHLVFDKENILKRII